MIADENSLCRLMALSQQGDRVAYATLLTECARWLRRFYARRIPPSALDDLVQDSLLSLHHKRASYDPSRPFLPWLAAIARYRWVDHLRKLYRRDETTLDDTLESASEAEATAAKISIDRLMTFLPERQADVIRLVKIEGLSIEEAASRTGQSEALVKVNIHRGLKKLSAVIERT